MAVGIPPRCTGALQQGNEKVMSLREYTTGQYWFPSFTADDLKDCDGFIMVDRVRVTSGWSGEYVNPEKVNIQIMETLTQKIPAFHLTNMWSVRGVIHDIEITGGSRAWMEEELLATGAHSGSLRIRRQCVGPMTHIC